MKAKGQFISMLLVIDTFLVSYAVGFNSRHVLVVDPSLPPLPPASASSAKATAGSSTEKKQAEHSAARTDSAHKSKSGGRKTSPGKAPATVVKRPGIATGKAKTKKPKKSRISAN